MYVQKDRLPHLTMPLVRFTLALLGADFRALQGRTPVEKTDTDGPESTG